MSSVRRSDFREVTPTDEEKAAWDKRYPNRAGSYTWRAEHIPCGKRIWYSGLSIGMHVKTCKGEQT
jgi:hypothetical protein